MDKIAFKSHKTRGQEIIKILENMGGVNKYNLDGSQGTVLAIEINYGNYITNDWDILGLMRLGYKIYTLEEYEKFRELEKSPSSPTAGLVEKEIKPKFKVGDKITNGEITFTILTLSSDRYGTEDIFGECGSVYFKSQDEWKIVEEKTSIKLTGKAIKNCEMVVSIDEWELPDGYIFKDERGNEIHATKIVLEKANTLKIQSNNMETETHRGYYTTEEETTNESKKVAWFTFEGNDFADKVELALSNRELIQEDGKWFVVKKKKEYPKTYEECSLINGCENRISLKIIGEFTKLINARNAYWKLYGEEMGLGKPWEPDYTNPDIDLYVIINIYNRAEKAKYGYGFEQCILTFPTAEMRDVFYENFKAEIEICKELL